MELLLNGIEVSRIRELICMQGSLTDAREGHPASCGEWKDKGQPCSIAFLQCLASSEKKRTP